LVKRAAGGDETALGEWVGLYWYPLYARSRRQGQSEADAKDMVQTFLIALWAQRGLTQADEGKGRLRTWLLTRFDRFLISEYRRATALKRGAGAAHVAIDWTGAELTYQNEPSLRDTPEALYARTWALTLLEEGIDLLELQYVEKNQGALFAALQPAITGGEERVNYKEQSAKLGKSEEALRTAVATLRVRYKKVLLQVASVRLGITNEEQLGEELRALLK
jgi:RNA polymerase sigma-70 factor (ECF subfamily)